MYYYDIFGWFTPQPIAGRSTLVAPVNTSTTTVEGEPRSNWTGFEWVVKPYKAGTLPQNSIEVPESVTMRQGRLALLAAGLLDSVDAALAAIPDSTERRAAQIEWEYAQTIDRKSDLVSNLSSALNLTEEQLDQLFVSAASL